MRHRLCVAPMMDVTDRHCRYFLRQVSSSAFLYTEMITTGALIHGDVERHLAFSKEEHPVALQLGGSEPDDLANCAKLGEQYGYDEINLNIGCPSERVQKGAFGACLMAEPRAGCGLRVSAIRDAVKIPVTVKHRTGIDYGRGLRIPAWVRRKPWPPRDARPSSSTPATRSSRASRPRRTARSRRSSTNMYTG